MVFLLVSSFELQARTFTPSARHLSRGNAYLTSATGMEAMLLNSSLLALDKTKEYTWPLISLQIGSSTESVLEIINNFQSLSGGGVDKVGDFFEKLVGQAVHGEASLYSGIYGPSWGTTVIVDFSLDVHALKRARKSWF